ncbi:NAD(P)-dependent oxidoreductase [uncultured Sphingomonas sp.]|uniref:NAD(P)-dependent oxidoreductase n=1 Tax=uncultured Sphingomonas sp. TaxID=158754 RepID=UPI0035C9CC6A
MRAEDRPLALVTVPDAIGAGTAAARVCDVVVWPDLADPAAFLAERAASVRAIVTVSTLPLPADLDRFPALELLAFFGAGYAMAETERCLQRGIAVTHGPGINHLDVADVAVGLVIAAVRGLAAGDRLIRAGGWRGLVPLPMTPSLRDLRYGIVGLGAIGTAVAERLAPFGGAIAWWGPTVRSDARWPRAASLIELARTSDVLVVAARGDEGTRGLIDAAVLAALGPAGYLVNVSRGFVVDEPALVSALREGRLAGVGLDVFDPEPTDPARWAGIETAVLSPHLGGAASASTAGAQALLTENLRRHFAGEALLTPVPR